MRRLVLALALLCAPSIWAQTPTVIQHVSFSNTLNGAGGGDAPVNTGTPGVNGFLPNKTLSGNAFVVCFTFDTSNSSTVSSLTDDQSNTYTQIATLHDATHTQDASCYEAHNTTAGVTVFHINFGTHTTPNVAGVFTEINNIATTSPVDVSNTRNAANTSITSNAITTTASGEFIYQYVTIDSGAGAQTWTAGTSPWQMLTSDRLDRQAMQWQIQASSGSITPTMTQGSANTFISIGFALKKASSGTALPAGIRVWNVQHNNTTDETVGSQTIQFPIINSGSLILVCHSAGGTHTISSITDTPGTTYTIAAKRVVTPDSAIILYGKNASASQANVLSITNSGTDVGGHGDTYFTAEVLGADTSAPLDTSFTGGTCDTGSAACADGNQPTGGGGGDITTFTTGFGGQNEVAIFCGSNAKNTATGWSSPTGALQLAETYSGIINPAHADENNPAGIFYNASDTASHAYTFTHNTTDSAGSGTWVMVGAAFKAPAAGGATPGVSKARKLEKLDQ